MPAQAHSSGFSMAKLFMVFGVALVAALLTLIALIVYIGKDLPTAKAANLEIPAAGLQFAFGDGQLDQNVVRVDEFSDGYALLSSGPVNIQAAQLQVLEYLWTPTGQSGELAFFWRQQGNSAEVQRTEITTTGSAYLNLDNEPEWHGEIVEIGFLVAGSAAQPVTIGPLILKPVDLATTLRLIWQDWTTYELRSQQSINFLQGGANNQIASLPVLLIIWWLIALMLLRLLSRTSALAWVDSSFLTLAVALLVSGWMLLDIRWTVNSYRSAGELLRNSTGSDGEQYSGIDLDGDIFKYVQRLKSDIIQSGENDSANRILLIGDENAIDYYLLRAKYHLLPDSAHVVGGFEEGLSPTSLDFVIYFGQPGAIANLPGWNTAWRNTLIEVERNEWGVVYRTQP